MATARLNDGSDGYDFYDENEDLVSELGSTGNLGSGPRRVWADSISEEVTAIRLSIPGGTLNEEADSNGYSAGIGYRQNKFFVDMSMVWLNSYEAYMMYPDDPRSNPLYISNPVNMYTKDKYLSFTVGLKF